MLRLAVVAKEFGQRPSDLLDPDEDFGTYERFCFDEACAQVLFQEKLKAQKDAEEEIRNNTGGQSARRKASPGAVSSDWMRQAQNKLKGTGKYKI